MTARQGSEFPWRRSHAFLEFAHVLSSSHAFFSSHLVAGVLDAEEVPDLMRRHREEVRARRLAVREVFVVVEVEVADLWEERVRQNAARTVERHRAGMIALDETGWMDGWMDG